MKKLLLTGVATIALAVGVFAQGAIVLDNSALANGFTIDTAGNYYAGTMGLEVWMANLASVPSGINLTPGPGTGVAGYSVMTATGSGFSLQHTYPGLSLAMVPGAVSLGELDMASAPKGGTVVLALAAWNTADASWNAMALAPSASSRAGVLAFMQPTVDYTPPALPPATLNWPNGTDLVMTTVPEPGVFALAGLGAAALLIFRRRK